MFKWIIFGIFAIGWIGLIGLNGLAKWKMESTMTNRISYLNQYEKNDEKNAAIVIKSNIVACLYDQAGGSIPKSTSAFVVENTLTLIRNFDNPSKNFIQDWREKTTKKLSSMKPKFSRMSKERAERIMKVFSGMEDGPHSLLGCVTKKMDLKI